ncbi:MAG: hypothetical protein Q9212_006179 [Teloschistes hypoglaucus]
MSSHHRHSTQGNAPLPAGLEKAKKDLADELAKRDLALNDRALKEAFELINALDINPKSANQAKSKTLLLKLAALSNTDSAGAATSPVKSTKPAIAVLPSPDLNESTLSLYTTSSVEASKASLDDYSDRLIEEMSLCSDLNPDKAYDLEEMGRASLFFPPPTLSGSPEQLAPEYEIFRNHLLKDPQCPTAQRITKICEKRQLDKSIHHPSFFRKSDQKSVQQVQSKILLLKLAALSNTNSAAVATSPTTTSAAANTNIRTPTQKVSTYTDDWVFEDTPSPMVYDLESKRRPPLFFPRPTLSGSPEQLAREYDMFRNRPEQRVLRYLTWKAYRVMPKDKL